MTKRDDVESTVDATLAAPVAAASEELPMADPDRYRERDTLAQGGMGRIVKAFDRYLRRRVALKELRVDSPELRARFEREVLLTARLEHPSIVTVHEAGRWPSGEPFYAMRLVPGRSLAQWIADASTLEARLALVPHVIAVADALAYAHGRRVIHRDLKPHNVMIGEFGETVVIDWGLAKDLSEAPNRPSSSTIDVTAVGTELGEVLGTPAYMPPEQALGQLADERADVYAIGAILYHVLSGGPPYRGTTTEVLDAVTRAAPPPLDLPVAPDLLAIVTRAMSREPADRYPTARELADDLRRFQAGQLVGAHRYSAWQLVRRWIHRYRALVGIAGVAIVGVIVLGVLSLRRISREQANTEHQREVAEHRRRDVEDLMTFMLGDMKAKLAPLGKLDLLDAVANKAAKYYADRSASDRDELDVEDEIGRSVALNNVGTVLQAEGHLAQALAAFRDSFAITQRLAAKHPTNTALQHDLWVDHTDIGGVLAAQGDTSAALDELRAGLAIGAQLVARDPAHASWPLELSISHDHIGDALVARGDLPGALDAYRAALAIRERLAAGDPTSAERQRELSYSYHKVGYVLSKQGDTAHALEKYRAELAIAEALASKDPANATLQRDLVMSYVNVGEASAARGDLATALQAYRPALAIMERLAAADPTNAVSQRDVSISHDHVADVLLEQGDVDGGLAEVRASLAIRERLAAKDPANADWQRDLSYSQKKLGDVLLKRGDTAGARASYEASLAVTERLVASDPTNAAWQADLASRHVRIGNALLADRHAASALDEYRTALAISSKLAPDTDGLATAHEKVGDALVASGNAASALDEYRAALAIRDKLAAKDPGNAKRAKEAAALRTKVDTCCGRR